MTSELKFVIARSNGSIFSLKHNAKCPSQTRVKRRKGRETEKKTANVQNYATSRRSRAGLPAPLFYTQNNAGTSFVI